MEEEYKVLKEHVEDVDLVKVKTDGTECDQDDLNAKDPDIFMTALFGPSSQHYCGVKKITSKG